MLDGRIEIITKRERRRRWSIADKILIVAEVREPGARIWDVAARHRVSESPVFTWRRQMREGVLVTPGVPVFMPYECLKRPFQLQGHRLIWIEHGLLLPIVLHCIDDASGEPMFGPPREGLETEEFLHTDHHDIPLVVPRSGTSGCRIGSRSTDRHIKFVVFAQRLLLFSPLLGVLPDLQNICYRRKLAAAANVHPCMHTFYFRIRNKVQISSSF